MCSKRLKLNPTKTEVRVVVLTLCSGTLSSSLPPLVTLLGTTSNNSDAGHLCFLISCGQFEDLSAQIVFCFFGLFPTRSCQQSVPGYSQIDSFSSAVRAECSGYVFWWLLVIGTVSHRTFSLIPCSTLVQLYYALHDTSAFLWPRSIFPAPQNHPLSPCEVLEIFQLCTLVVLKTFMVNADCTSFLVFGLTCWMLCHFFELHKKKEHLL